MLNLFSTCKVEIYVFIIQSFQSTRHDLSFKYVYIHVLRYCYTRENNHTSPKWLRNSYTGERFKAALAVKFCQSNNSQHVNVMEYRTKVILVNKLCIVPIQMEQWKSNNIHVLQFPIVALKKYSAKTFTVKSVFLMFIVYSIIRLFTYFQWKGS